MSKLNIVANEFIHLLRKDTAIVEHSPNGQMLFCIAVVTQCSFFGSSPPPILVLLLPYHCFGQWSASTHSNSKISNVFHKQQWNVLFHALQSHATSFRIRFNQTHTDWLIHWLVLVRSDAQTTTLQTVHTVTYGSNAIITRLIHIAVHDNCWI